MTPAQHLIAELESRCARLGVYADAQRTAKWAAIERAVRAEGRLRAMRDDYRSEMIGPWADVPHGRIGCRKCGRDWRKDGAEVHEPGCLAE